MNATAILSTIANRIEPHLEQAASNVLAALDYEPLKQYLESKPRALITALDFQAKVEAIAMVTKQPIHPEMVRLFKARMDTIMAVFIAEVISPKGDAHVMKFIELMRVDDTFTVFNMSVLREAQEIARHATRISKDSK